MPIIDYSLFSIRSAVIFMIALFSLTVTDVTAQAELPPACRTPAEKPPPPPPPPPTQAFYLKVDSTVSSASNRRGDLVQFSVIDDVSVKHIADQYKATKKWVNKDGNWKLETECTLANAKDSTEVFIPAGTRGYGVVDSRRNRKGLWIGGKSKILVRLLHLQMKEGTKLEIEFDNVMQFDNLLPCDDNEREARQDRPGPTREAPKVGEQCIDGRRPTIDWASAAMAPVLAAINPIVKSQEDPEDNSNTFVTGYATIGFLEKTSGLGAVINGTDSTILPGTIFPVKLKPVP